VIEDASSMFRNWVSDMDICRYMRWLPHKDIEETKSAVSNWIEAYSRDNVYLWVITLKENEEPIGTIGLFAVNENDLCGDFAYCISKNYWGKGIATEALRAVMAFAFDTIGFNRLEAYHSINNPSSGRVMEKVGMIFEGLAKQKYKSISGFEDCNMYAMIKKDFILSRLSRQ